MRLTNSNYTTRQLKLPLEIEKLIDISDPVYTFCEVVDHIDLTPYFVDYTSNLSAYSDSRKLKSWAVEAMAFMNALGLIEGTSDTTLSPNAVCTIEQAVSVAYRSIYAHQIGWYQATESVRYQSAAGGVTTYITLDKGERIWVTGNRIGAGVGDTTLDQNKGAYKGSSCYFPVVEPRTGETCYINATKLKPIRD